jgi:hypothetical protein
MVPEPSSWTRGPALATLRKAYMPLMMSASRRPASRVLVVLVHHREVVEDVFLLGEHAAHAVLMTTATSYWKVGS